MAESQSHIVEAMESQKEMKEEYESKLKLKDFAISDLESQLQQLNLEKQQLQLKLQDAEEETALVKQSYDTNL